jgi:RNA polymerase sigma-70 factor (ECF subfamily)
MGLGPAGDAFQTTHWSEILRARTQDDARRREVLNTILERYWRPVYCYLRRKGRSDADAKDLTQGFFHEVVLGRGLLQQADRERGRFRNLLLTALTHYVTSEHRAEAARKRRPDAMNAPPQSKHLDRASPEDAFHHAWASALLDQVLGDVRRECCQGGKAVHWEVFRARVLGPIMEDAAPPSLADLCAAHGIVDEAKASNMIITVKRRFQAALTRRIRERVSSDAEVEEEIRDLVEILSRPGAGF